MRVSDVVTLNREKYYNGAVQTEWFYDEEKVKGIAESYVFHGPKYYGVSASDVSSKDHTLIDTASFTQKIAKKLYDKDVDNSFVLTIAGYGTGKSHLAVTLGALFSGNHDLQDPIVNNIASVDEKIASDIRARYGSRNLVIALNGMKNFNLDAEVLQSVRLALKLNGIDDSVIKSLTKTYEVAKYFINENFENCSALFNNAASSCGVMKEGDSLKRYLLSNIETDAIAIDIVNSVFKKMTGDVLHWEKGISAGDVILKISDELCGEGKPFNKILVLFDEFGRYIEYVAANPLIAGDASLQQVFEAIQSSEGRAVFVGFVQYELEAYLKHIDKSSNVIRYVGRYSASEKYYLSSNFETILANLLEKSKSGSFERSVCHSLDRYEKYHNNVHSALDRWSERKLTKNVWKSDSLYRKVIMEGCYPLHPITVWLLSNSSGWMQQRSTITFCAEMYESMCNMELDGDWLPYIYPVDIIDSGIFSEMLNSEEKGLVKSQYCMLFNEISMKVGEKLTKEEMLILKAVLISRIAGFKFFDKEEAYTAFKYCTNLKEEVIKLAVKNLEDRHGVIAFDEQAKTYDLIAEANGFNEFKRVFARYRTGTASSIEDMDEEMMKELGILDPIDTAFAQENHISSQEWKFNKYLVDSSDIDGIYIDNILRTIDSAFDGENSRGAVLYAYCKDDSESEIKRLTRIHKEKELDKAPVIIILLDDSDGEITQALTVKNTMLRFSMADNERFAKHIAAQKRSQNKKIIQLFNTMVMARKQITNEGLCNYDCRLNALCTNKFKAVYSKPVPFVFDGFENSKSSQARKTLITLCIKMFDRSLMNIQSYQALSTADKNRVQSCIAVGSNFSWQIFSNSCQLVLPQNELIKRIYNEVDASISDDGEYSVGRLFGKCLHAPYGMNVYSYSLFVIYFILKHEKKLICYLGNDKLSAENLSNNIFKDGKLKFSELQRVKIQKNLNADIDVVAELCNEIMNNSDVNKCQTYKRRLNEVIKTEGGNPQNQLLIGQAEMRLEDGERLKSRIEERRNKIESIMDESSKKFSIPKFIAIFDFVDDSYGIIEEGLPYTYPQSWVEFLDGAKKRVNNLMGQTFDASLEKMKCDITQLSGFKRTYAKSAEILRANGYGEKADALVNRVGQVAEETQARNQYNQVLGECEKDVAIFSDVSAKNFDECDVILGKLDGWNKFFADSNIPVSVSGVLKDKISEIYSKVIARKDTIMRQVSDLVLEGDEAETLDDLLDVRADAEDLLEMKLPDYKEQSVKKLIGDINDLEERIGKLPQTIDALKDIIGSPHEKIVFSDVFNSMANERLNELQCEEIKWAENVLIPIENGHDLDAQQCTTMLDKLRSNPSFVSLETIKRIQAAEQEVTNKLHKCRVQGVLSLYNSLSEEEKKEFIRLITG